VGMPGSLNPKGKGRTEKRNSTPYKRDTGALWHNKGKPLQKDPAPTSDFLGMDHFKKCGTASSQSRESVGKPFHKGGGLSHCLRQKKGG